MRNRLIAALADATLVVEAGKRSGAISTVNHAIAIGRAVGAVPGQVSASSSVGCNRLIQSGEAVLIQDSSDLLELLAINSHLFDTSPEFEANARFGPTQVRLLDALTNRAKAPDLVAVAAGLTPTEAHVAFSSLALAGFVAETDTGWVKLKTLAG
jgi:DNA processing protein